MFQVKNVLLLEVYYISKEEFLSVDGAEDFIDEISDRIINSTYVDNIPDLIWDDRYFTYFSSGGILLGQWGPTTRIRSLEPSSYLFNEAGFFVVNFVADVDWEIYENMQQNWSDVISSEELYFHSYYKRVDEGNYRSRYESVDGEFTMDKLTVAATISYINGELELVNVCWGEQPEYSGERDVVVVSDFSYFPGLDYYKNNSNSVGTSK